MDTLHAAKTLQGAGFNQAQAEALVNTIGQAVGDSVATKNDISELRGDFDQTRVELRAELDQTRVELRAELDQTRVELRTELARLQTDLERLRAELRADLERSRAESRADLERSRAELYRAMAVQTVAIIAAVVTLLKFM